MGDAFASSAPPLARGTRLERSLGAWAGLGLLALLVACNSEAKLDRFGRLPQFELQNQLGERFTDADLRGRVVVVDFIFTSCPDVCPLLTQQLATLRKRMPLDAPLSFASFSVDPEHDTPEVLRRYAAHPASCVRSPSG